MKTKISKTDLIKNFFKANKKTVIGLLMGAAAAGGYFAPAAIPVITEIVCNVSGGCE